MSLILIAVLVQDAPFENMKKAIQGRDAALFKAQWHPEGYEKNLTGGSGLTGASVYEQATRKDWYLKPDPAKAVVMGEGVASIYPCEIWLWKMEKSVDKVHILVVKSDQGWVTLGGGERLDQVKALAERWLKKDPLPPPGK